VRNTPDEPPPPVGSQGRAQDHRDGGDTPEGISLTTPGEGLRLRRTPFDLRADIHGRAVDFANDLDRAFFEQHPGTRTCTRPPVEHEWCGPGADGTCTPLPGSTPGTVAAVTVVLLGDGLRARIPESTP